MYILLFLYICDMKPIFIISILLIFFQLDAPAGIPYKWKPIDPVYDSLALRMEEAAFKDDDRQNLIPVVQKMYHLAKEKKSPALLARSCYWDASIQFSINKDSASVLIDKAIGMTDTIEYPHDYARMLLVKSEILRNKGNWAQAYFLCKKSEQYFKEYKDIFSLAKTYVTIGIILRELQEHETSLKYLTKGEEAFKESGSINCTIKNKLNISNELYCLGRKQEALDILKSLVQNPVARRDTFFLVNTMISYYSISDQAEKRYAVEAHYLAKKYGNLQLTSMTQVCMGANMLTEHKNDSAIYYYKRAYNDFNYNNYKSNLFPILCGLSEAYSRLNKPDSAYYFLKEYENSRDSLLARDKVLEVSRSESRAAVEKYESDIRRAEEKAQWQTKITWLITCSITALSLLVFYILWLSRNKEKIKKQLKEVENRELTLQNQQYLGEIDSKNRELTSNTLVIAENSQTLKGLLKEVEDLSTQGALPPKEANTLKRKIREHLVDSDEWQYFKLHFENVHPHFFSKLKDFSPNLSENDMRLCAYIRIGMSTKQMAQMLSVLPDTIITTRYRIRKKLGLLQDDSLEDFLRNFS